MSANVAELNSCTSGVHVTFAASVTPVAVVSTDVVVPSSDSVSRFPMKSVSNCKTEGPCPGPGPMPTGHMHVSGKD